MHHILEANKIMQLSNLKARLAAKTILQLNGPPHSLHTLGPTCWIASLHLRSFFNPLRGCNIYVCSATEAEVMEERRCLDPVYH